MDLQRAWEQVPGAEEYQVPTRSRLLKSSSKASIASSASLPSTRRASAISRYRPLPFELCRGRSRQPSAFEADLLTYLFGLRSHHAGPTTASNMLIEVGWEDKLSVVETDIASCVKKCDSPQPASRTISRGRQCPLDPTSIRILLSSRT